MLLAKKSIIIVVAFLVSSCNINSSENDYRQLMTTISSSTLELEALNSLIYQKVLKEQVSKSDNERTYTLMLEAANLIGGLSGDYIMNSGGMTLNQQINNPLAKGVIGYNLFQKHEMKRKLEDIIEKLNSLDQAQSIEAVKQFKYVIDRKFLSANPHFNEETLKQKPLSVITLELLVVENTIYGIIMNNMN
jgi:hypothetical protein